MVTYRITVYDEDGIPELELSGLTYEDAQAEIMCIADQEYVFEEDWEDE